MTERTLVVVPTYNEAMNIEGLIASLLEVDGSIDVVVVDDGSPDGTADVVHALGLTAPARVHLIRQDRKGGRGAAVLAGLRRGLEDTRYVSFVEMDADLSHLPAELSRLLDEGRGADVVIGSRYLPGSAIVGWSFRRRVWSRMSNRLIDRVLRLPVSDYTNGYRCYSRRAVAALAAMQLQERGYISLSEWAVRLHQAGMGFANVPTTFVNRRVGQSKMSLGEAAGAVRGLIRLRRAASGRP